MYRIRIAILIVACTIGSTDTVFTGHFHIIKTRDIDRNLIGIATAFVMGIDTTVPAEKMPGNFLVPLIRQQMLFAGYQAKPALVFRFHHNCFFGAQRTVAPVNIGQNILRLHLKAHALAMTGTGMGFQHVNLRLHRIWPYVCD